MLDKGGWFWWCKEKTLDFIPERSTGRDFFCDLQVNVTRIMRGSYGVCDCLLQKKDLKVESAIFNTGPRREVKQCRVTLMLEDPM